MEPIPKEFINSNYNKLKRVFLTISSDSSMKFIICNFSANIIKQTPVK